ncbi:MAG: hypothetical protein E6J82_09570 [Deltaproteobacteria bacterium]|nr:MAG: hypothetical protein E6J82_09570 [Deltaproteobacteria bacterium]
MTDARLAELVERAFDYRGYVTLRRTDGSELVGFVYDRSASHLDLYDETATRRVRVSLADVADIAFTGDDAARKAQALWEWRESGPVLLLVALDRELRSVARALGLVRRGDRARGQSGGNEVVGLALGVGGGARRAVVDEQPRLVVSCGFSGALDPALAPGDLVLATAVRDETGDELAAPPLIRQRAAEALGGLRYFEGELVCTTAVAATEVEKLALARPGALAVDMESYPVARAASAAGIPWLAIRAIVDPLRSSLPAFTRDPAGGYVGPAMKYALSGPRAAVELVRLAARARAAAAALEVALHRLRPMLGATEARA